MNYEDFFNGTSFLNFTEIEIENLPNVHPLEAYLIPISFFLIFILGILGHFTLILIFLKEKSVRSIPNTYIMSLTLSNLLEIVFYVPFFSIIFTVDSWPWGSIVCKFSSTISDISIGVSVFTLTALTVERYYAMRKLQTKSFVLKLIIFIWAIGCVFAIPSAIFTQVQAYELFDKETRLVCQNFISPLHDIYIALIHYIIPFLIISYYYILMVRNLNVSTRNVPIELGIMPSSHDFRNKKHDDKMVLTLVIAFFMCFLPSRLLNLWFNLNSTTDYNFYYWQIFLNIGYCLSIFYSCINPIVLYFVSDVYRQHFKKYLCYCIYPRNLNRQVE